MQYFSVLLCSACISGKTPQKGTRHATDLQPAVFESQNAQLRNPTMNLVGSMD